MFRSSKLGRRLSRRSLLSGPGRKRSRRPPESNRDRDVSLCQGLQRSRPGRLGRPRGQSGRTGFGLLVRRLGLPGARLWRPQAKISSACVKGPTPTCGTASAAHGMDERWQRWSGQRKWMNCRLVLSLGSQCFHKRRHFSSQANERSTTQR